MHIYNNQYTVHSTSLYFTKKHAYIKVKLEHLKVKLDAK